MNILNAIKDHQHRIRMRADKSTMIGAEIYLSDVQILMGLVDLLDASLQKTQVCPVCRGTAANADHVVKHPETCPLGFLYEKYTGPVVNLPRHAADPGQPNTRYPAAGIAHGDELYEVAKMRGQQVFQRNRGPAIEPRPQFKGWHDDHWAYVQLSGPKPLLEKVLTDYLEGPVEAERWEEIARIDGTETSPGDLIVLRLAVEPARSFMERMKREKATA